MSDLGSYKRAQEARKALLNRGARRWLDADGSEDAAVAQHEAGHALVGRLLGLNPTETTIEPGFNFGGRTTWANKPDRGRRFARSQGRSRMMKSETPSNARGATRARYCERISFR